MQQTRCIHTNVTTASFRMHEAGRAITFALLGARLTEALGG